MNNQSKCRDINNPVFDNASAGDSSAFVVPEFVRRPGEHHQVRFRLIR
jgi:hypothetical protein